MDIAAWLTGLGLGEYAAAFRDNDIDVEVLPKLTAEDLTAIGVRSIGHRRKLLSAIAALAESRGPRPRLRLQDATAADVTAPRQSGGSSP